MACSLKIFNIIVMLTQGYYFSGDMLASAENRENCICVSVHMCLYSAVQKNAKLLLLIRLEDFAF